MPVTAKIEFCTEQNLELSVLEIYVVSAAKPQLPLQIEDASRPEKDDVCKFLTAENNIKFILFVFLLKFLFRMPMV